MRTHKAREGDSGKWGRVRQVGTSSHIGLFHSLVLIASPVIVLSITGISLAGPVEFAWNAYLAGDFSRVGQIVQASGGDTSLSAQDRARLYFTLGCSEAMRGHEAASINSFRNAFGLFPQMHHSEAELPPPVWRIYEPIQSEFEADRTRPLRLPQSPVTGGKVSRDTVRVYQPVTHSGSVVMKSALFPGWGHLAEGDKTGYLFMGTESLLLIGLAVSFSSMQDARDDYLRARAASNIGVTYSRYNARYRTAWAVGLAAAGVYVTAQWHLFTRPPKLHLASIEGSPPLLQLTFAL